ncbi:hypothetical protein ABPG74_008065, partial [Tetrahymena malaccensis]
ENQIGDSGALQIGQNLISCTNLINLKFSMGQNQFGNEASSAIGRAQRLGFIYSALDQILKQQTIPQVLNLNTYLSPNSLQQHHSPMRGGSRC